MDMRTLREKVLTISTNAKEGHIPSALSVLDLMWVLYDRILKVDPTNTQWPDRDRFVLSKGHASIGLYVVLAQKGFFPMSEFIEIKSLVLKLRPDLWGTDFPSVLAWH